MSRLVGDQRAIGVFDSGVGGLTVVSALRTLLPTEEIIYLGDTARLPYGTKSDQTVQRYARTCYEFLCRQDVKLVVVACNTASATALTLLSDLEEVPVLGVVEPGAAAACLATRSQRIGVLATTATVATGAYPAAVQRRLSQAVVSQLACPLLCPLVEEGWTDGPIASAVARRYLARLAALDPEIDTLVLGCTHYPLLRSTIGLAAAEIFSRVPELVDSTDATAEAVGHRLDQGGLRRQGDAPGSLRCYVTDVAQWRELAGRFLGEAIARLERVDL